MDPAMLLTAAAGAVVGISGAILSWQARRDTQRHQTAAERVEEQKTRLAETQQAVDTYERLTERLAVERRRASERADEAEAALERERAAHRATRADAEAQAARCRAAQTELLEALATLRQVVADEIAAEAAADAVTASRPHPHLGTDPVPTTQKEGGQA